MNRPKRRYINHNGSPKFRKERFLFWQWSGWMCASILLFSFIYYIGSWYGWGITQGELSREVNFMDCLYFSVVTISTLGYGDWRPISYSRGIASVEVLSGIVISGIFISRYVSNKQQLLTERLVKGSLNLEIQRFREQVLVLNNRFQGSSQLATNSNQAIQEDDLLYNASGLMKSIARYFRHETGNSSLKNLFPVSAIGRLLAQTSRIVEESSRVSASLTFETIHRKHRVYIRNICESHLVICDFVEKALGDHTYSTLVDNTYRTIEEMRTKFKLTSRA